VKAVKDDVATDDMGCLFRVMSKQGNILIKTITTTSSQRRTAVTHDSSSTDTGFESLWDTN
jgi:hypothetical protein